MPGFRVSRRYTKPREQVRAHAEELAQELQDRFGTTARWQGDTVTMRGHGIDGTLEIDDEAVHVNVKLGLMAAMFERPIRRAVDEYLDHYVG